MSPACLPGCLSEHRSGNMSKHVPVIGAPWQLQVGIDADLAAQLTALMLCICHQQTAGIPVSL